MPIMLAIIVIRIIIAIILICDKFLTIKTGDQFKITIIKIGYIIIIIILIKTGDQFKVTIIKIGCIIIIIIIITLIKTGDLPNTLFCTCRSHLCGLQWVPCHWAPTDWYNHNLYQNYHHHHYHRHCYHQQYYHSHCYHQQYYPFSSSYSRLRWVCRDCGCWPKSRTPGNV